MEAPERRSHPQTWHAETCVMVSLAPPVTLGGARNENRLFLREVPMNMPLARDFIWLAAGFPLKFNTLHGSHAHIHIYEWRLMCMV